MSKIITKTNPIKLTGYIKANKSIFHPRAKKPFIEGNIYKFGLEESSYVSDKYVLVNIIYANTEERVLEALDTEESRKDFAKFVNKNFTECSKPTYTIDVIINPREYKFCIEDGQIKEIKFDTVLYTEKTSNGKHCYERYINQYSTFLGIFKTPPTAEIIKEKDYVLKTKIDVLKEIYGDFQVENPSSYDLVQEGFCTNGWYNRNNSPSKHYYSEIFYANGEKYLSGADSIPDLLADSVLIENCFKTKQEAILKLLGE